MLFLKFIYVRKVLNVKSVEISVMVFVKFCVIIFENFGVSWKMSGLEVRSVRVMKRVIIELRIIVMFFGSFGDMRMRSKVKISCVVKCFLSLGGFMFFVGFFGVFLEMFLSLYLCLVMM